MFSSGLVRFTASVPRHVDALEWLRGAHSNESANRRALAASARVLPEPADASARGALGRRRRRRGRRRRRHVRTRRGNDRERRLRRFTRRCTNVTKWRRGRETTSPSLLRGAPIRAAPSPRRAVRWCGPAVTDSTGTSWRTYEGSSRRSAGGSDETGPRVYGAGRFDPATAPAEEWARFGGHYFFLPTVEVAEGARSATVAVAVAWDAASGEDFAETSEALGREGDRGGARSAPRVLARRRRRRRTPRRRARNGGTPKRVSEKSRRRSLAPPGSRTPLGKTLEPDRAGWSAVVGSAEEAARGCGFCRRRGGGAAPSAPSPPTDIWRCTQRNAGTVRAETPFAARIRMFIRRRRGCTSGTIRARARARDGYIDEAAAWGRVRPRRGLGQRSLDPRPPAKDRSRGGPSSASPPHAVLKELEAFAMRRRRKSSVQVAEDGVAAAFRGRHVRGARRGTSTRNAASTREASA